MPNKKKSSLLVVARGVAIPLFLFVFGGVVLWGRSGIADLPDGLEDVLFMVAVIFVVSAVLMSIGGLLWLVLRPDEGAAEDEGLSAEVSELRSVLDAVRSEVADLSHALPSEGAIERVEAPLTEHEPATRQRPATPTGDPTQPNRGSSRELEIRLERARRAHRAQLRRTAKRLGDEIRSVGRRSTMNLIIGGLTSALAVVLLLVLTAAQSPDAKNWATWLPMATHRLPLIVLIELISFFFLRLYKAGVSEVRFYQNELTTLEQWHLALEIGLAAGDKDCLRNVVGNISLVDRNSTASIVELTRQARQTSPPMPTTDSDRGDLLTSSVRSLQDALE